LMRLVRLIQRLVRLIKRDVVSFFADVV